MVRASFNGGLRIVPLVVTLGWTILLSPGMLHTSAAISSGEARTLQFGDGKRAMAVLRDLRSIEEMDWEIDGESKRLPATKFLAWGRRATLRSRGAIVLSDGSVFATEEPFAFQPPSDASTVWPRDGIGSPANWSRSKVLAVFARLPIDRDERERVVIDAFTNDVEEESLELANGDRVVGQWQEPVTDANGDEPSANVRWKSRAGTIEVPWDRVRCLRFRTKLQPSADARLIVGFNDGSKLMLRSLQSDGERIELELVCGLRLKATAESVMDAVVSIESLSTDRVFLSDLEPLSYKHVPYLSKSWPLGNDRTSLGTSLHSSGAIVSKGLGMHSTSRVAYDVSAGYARFESLIGLDENVGVMGSVVFRVFVDQGDGMWAAAYESPVMRVGDKAEPVSIDISKAERIALIVDAADRGDLQDHANWLYARLVRWP
ncbi:MAG: hypothetical protein RIS70_2523 [Planctomycetota bacterium]|jgi:hypothetical protein